MLRQIILLETKPGQRDSLNCQVENGYITHFPAVGEIVLFDRSYTGPGSTE